MSSDSFKEYVMDQLEGLRKLSARSMFGGWGLSSDGAFFGLVDDDTLFFFVDDLTRPEYEALEAKPFMYSRDGKSVTMSYYAVPESIHEDREELAIWARKAVEARKRKPAKKKR